MKLKDIKNAQTVCGNTFKVESEVCNLRGSLIRYEGTVVNRENENVAAAWAGNGELISIDKHTPFSCKDTEALSLVIIKPIESEMQPI